VVKTVEMKIDQVGTYDFSGGVEAPFGRAGGKIFFHCRDAALLDRHVQDPIQVAGWINEPGHG
jgi:hypothetical protein